MSDIDQETLKWLQSLKLNKNFKTIADFETGYNFGVIFDKLQLSKGKKFKKHNSDMACIFQNYKNVRDLLMENFGYDFPINNIIYRTEDLLKVIRDQTIKYQERKKEATLKAATTIKSHHESMIEPREEKLFKTRENEIKETKTNYMNQTTKMPKKIQEIEKKLEKFREEKTRHQLFALDDRKRQIEDNRQMIQNHRQYELNKLRKMHDLTKQNEKKVFDVWAKTEQIKRLRIEKDQEFNNFMQEKKNKHLSSLRRDQQKTVSEGLQAFQLNCIRHGIELEHDPDKPLKPEGQFNKVVVMERIKDNIKRHQHQKKERIKRENKKRVDAQQVKKKSEQLWEQNNKLQDYQSKIQQHLQYCSKQHSFRLQQEAEKQTIQNKIGKKKFVSLPAIGDQQSRAEEYRKGKLQFLKNEVIETEKKWNKIHSMTEDIVEALLQSTIEGEEVFEKQNSFSYPQWKQVEKIFLNYSVQKNKLKGKKNKIYIDHSIFEDASKAYIQEAGQWKSYSLGQKKYEGNTEVAKVVDLLINLSYPEKTVQKPADIPLHVPLKVILGGNRLSGKSTHTAKLLEGFDVKRIDPVQIIKQALELAKPPPEDDKKKKDSKKVEQLSADKLALKDYGLKLLQTGLSSVQHCENKHFIDAIKYKLKQLFPLKNKDEILEQFEISKQKQLERYNQALKDFDEGAKKPKKDSKKAANESQDEPPKSRELFYTNGFVIDNYPLNLTTCKQLEKQLCGYIPDSERINQNACQLSERFQLVLAMPQREVSSKLKNGSFDHIFQLTANVDELSKRKEGRKIDPSTKMIYHPDYNPFPTDVKGFAEKLIDLPVVEVSESYENGEVQQFYQSFGNERIKQQAFKKIQTNISIDQSFNLMKDIIKENLLAKYQQYEEDLMLKKQEKQEAEQKVEQPQQSPTKKDQSSKTIKSQQKQGEPEMDKNQVTENQEGKKQDGVNQNNEKQQTSEQKVENLSKKNIDELTIKNDKYKKSIAQLIQELQQSDLSYILSKHELGLNLYLEGIQECMFLLENERRQFQKNLFILQKDFVSVINRPDDKAGKILAFQENYNKLLSEQQYIVRDIDASNHLVKKLDQLYDSLWESLSAKKNEAVDERQKLIRSCWLNQQCEKLVTVGQKLLQVQLNFICETAFAILKMSCRIQGISSDYVNEYLSIGIAPSLEPISSISNDLNKCERFQYFIKQIDHCLQTLPEWIEQKRKKMKIEKIQSIESLINHFVNYSIAHMQRRKNIIGMKIKERIWEERVYYNALVNKMDEWIIQGVKSENDFVYQIYKNMKKMIQEARRSNVKDLYMKEITDTFLPIKNLTTKALPIRLKTTRLSLPIYSFMIFLIEIKTLTNNLGKINFDILKKYFQKRKKSSLLDEIFLRVDFDTISQYLVKDGFVEFKELTLALLLWNVNVFDDDTLAKYRSKLLKETEEEVVETKPEKEETQRIQQAESNDQEKKQSDVQEEVEKQKQQEPEQQQKLEKDSFIRTSRLTKKLTFEELILMEGVFDPEQEYVVKCIIFEIFREEGMDFIEAQGFLDTFYLFDRLQVLRYGDTVMMLD